MRPRKTGEKLENFMRPRRAKGEKTAKVEQVEVLVKKLYEQNNAMSLILREVLLRAPEQRPRAGARAGIPQQAEKKDPLINKAKRLAVTLKNPVKIIEPKVKNPALKNMAHEAVARKAQNEAEAEERSAKKAAQAEARAAQEAAQAEARAVQNEEVLKAVDAFMKVKNDLDNALAKNERDGVTLDPDQEKRLQELQGLTLANLAELETTLDLSGEAFDESLFEDMDTSPKKAPTSRAPKVDVDDLLNDLDQEVGIIKSAGSQRELHELPPEDLDQMQNANDQQLEREEENLRQLEEQASRLEAEIAERTKKADSGKRPSISKADGDDTTKFIKTTPVPPPRTTSLNKQWKVSPNNQASEAKAKAAPPPLKEGNRIGKAPASTMWGKSEKAETETNKEQKREPIIGRRQGPK